MEVDEPGVAASRTVPGPDASQPEAAPSADAAVAALYQANVLALSRLAYVMLGDRQALEDLRMHRRKLALDLKGRRGSYDFSLPLGQIDEEIAIIEAGLERLNKSTNL